MAATMNGSTVAQSPRPNRGKDQLHWSDDVWHAIDQAVIDEITRSRMGAKFLPQVHVHKKRTTVESDKVVLGTSTDPSLSVDESNTSRVQEYSGQFRLSPAQMEAEGNYDLEVSNQVAASSTQGSADSSQGSMHHPLRASTAMSLAVKTANILAQAEDLIIFNGQNAVANSPLFQSNQVQPLDPKLLANLDLGLLNIQPLTAGFLPLSIPTPPAVGSGSGANVIMLPVNQVIPVAPVGPVQLKSAPSFPPRYAENTLNAVAQGVSVLQGQGHYDNYALILHTYPYADLHQALANTLIEPVEPISQLVKAGIYGTGALPPFIPVTNPNTNPAGQSPTTGLPTHIVIPPSTTPVPLSTALPALSGNVLYTGFLLALGGNTVDLVRGLMDDALDVSVTFNQKDANEQYRFRAVQRFCLRFKDVTAGVLFLFTDTIAADGAVIAVPAAHTTAHTAAHSTSTR